ncbi:Hypothetical_protein [Hexamita inflata]|uniref:Hypothetical_protein n=1 Tax=Hexamita inflata TaxID=28002 RepID=A0ABP1HMH1_9EUKA
MWNRIEIIALWTYCVLYNKDYAFVQKHFMSKFTVRQISSQFIQIVKKQVEMHQFFKNVLQEPLILQSINDNEFKMHWWILRLACKRLTLIKEKLCYQPGGSVLEAVVQADFAEIPALKAFFQDVDPQDLILFYKREEIRRGLENEPFLVPKYQNDFMK